MDGPCSGDTLRLREKSHPSFASLFLRVSARYIFTPHFKSIFSINMKDTIRGRLGFAYNNRLTSLQCRETGSAWARGHIGSLLFFNIYIKHYFRSFLVQYCF